MRFPFTDKVPAYIFRVYDLTLKLPTLSVCLSRYVYRDIGGSDPERSAAPRVAEYVVELFKNTCIKVDVLSDLAVMQKEYPMLCAVNRACQGQYPIYIYIFFLLVAYHKI